jgi:hypothetical protein
MNRIQRALRQFRIDTTPSEDGVRRVWERVGPLTPEDIRRATEPTSAAEERVWAKVDDVLNPLPVIRRPWRPVLVTMSVAAAAAAVAWVVTRPVAEEPAAVAEIVEYGPQMPVVPFEVVVEAPKKPKKPRSPKKETPVDLVNTPLEAVEWAEVRPVPDVLLAYKGKGIVGGSNKAPVVQWEAGQLSVEVAEGKGIDLVVRTAEGAFAVVGTGFTVTRDEDGSRLFVRHGTVRMTCNGAEPKLYNAGQGGICFRDDASETEK